MAEESLGGNTASKLTGAADAPEDSTPAPSNDAHVDSDEDEENDDVAEAGKTSTSSAAKKKKKKKRSKGKATADAESQETKPDVGSSTAGNLTDSQVSQLLSMDPSLAQRLGVSAGSSVDSATETLKGLKLADVMAALAASGRSAKDMASYKFWQTQPVPRLGEKVEQIEEGPFKIIDPEQVPKEPGPLIEGFEWVTMDITDKDQLKEIYDLLAGHYVEDQEEMFRFNYSPSFLKW